MSASDRAARARGFTLLELVFLVIIMGIAGTAVTVGIDQAVRASADPIRHKQAIAVAEGYLDEVMSFPFAPAGWSGAATQGNRATFDDMRDFNGFTSEGVHTRGGQGVAGLGGYTVSVTVVDSPAELIAAIPAMPAIPATDMMRVRVRVTGAGRDVTLDTYAFNF